MIEFLLSTFVTFFVVVDPPGIAPMFISLTHAVSAVERRRIALRGVAIATGVLFAFALGGGALLDVLGIGIPAFRVAGGVLLLLLSIDMVMVRPSGLRATTESEEAEASQRHDVTVFPLAIPLIAGPGAIASVVLAMGKTAGDPLHQALLLLVLLSVLVLTALLLLAADRLLRLFGRTGLNVLTRVFGILLAALAVQFVIDGLKAAFAT